MLTQKTNQKKNLIYGAVLGVIFIIIAVLLLKDHIFIGSDKKENSFLAPQTDFKVFDMPSEKFDSGFLNDSRYRGLKDNSVKIKDMEDLKIGKKNPFAVD